MIKFKQYDRKSNNLHFYPFGRKMRVNYYKSIYLPKLNNGYITWFYGLINFFLNKKKYYANIEMEKKCSISYWNLKWIKC